MLAIALGAVMDEIESELLENKFIDFFHNYYEEQLSEVYVGYPKKMVKAAAASGKEPQQFVDELATSFRDTWNELGISYDDFIRTTEQRHIDTVTRFLERMQKNGDL